MNEPRPMIENSDRGITLAKPLAWSILGSIVAVVWFGGPRIEAPGAAISGNVTVSAESLITVGVGA